MKRKVAQIGPSTLMVSLPSKWAKENNIKKGDELELTVRNKEIILSKDKEKTKDKEIELDITNFNKYLLTRYLEVLYITNFNRIKLNYSKNTIYDDKNKTEENFKSFIKKRSNQYIGMEIISQSNNSTELQCFLFDEEKDLNKIEKRIFFLFKETIEQFLLSLENNNHVEFHQSVCDHHNNIVKFITYYLRVLNQSDKSTEEKKQLYSLYMIIDKMVDKFRHLSESIERYGHNSKVKNVLKEIFELIYEQFLCLHKGKIPKELITKRYDLFRKVRNIKYTREELSVVSEIKIFLDTINDFSRAVIVKELGEYS